MKNIFFSLAFVLFIFSTSLFSQTDDIKSETSDKSEQDILDEAEYYFTEANYAKALPLFQKLHDAHPSDVYSEFKLGICCIYKSEENENAIKHLEQVYRVASKTKDLTFYLGIAYHINYKFDEAIKYFNEYLATNPPVSKKVTVNKYIDNCKNGKVMTQTKFRTNIKNLGAVVNTRYSEYVPVISSDESILIFTYRGKRSKGGLMDEKLKPSPTGDYYEDIFISQKVGSEWLSPESIGDNINTKGHDACIALSADGQKLFIYKSTPRDQGDIYMSVLEGEIWSEPKKLGPTINTKHWEGSVSMSSDEQTLYFASERPEGLGKRDIWMAHKLPNGEWGEAINMGPKINTNLNEDAPFIHPDGVTLFFSSEGHNSIGGYDIMYSTLENSEWSSPINLEFPVNTTEDDRFYVLSGDGERGYFSSNRKGGFGQQDLYVVTPGIQGDKPVLALVVGITSSNGKPKDAIITIFNEETNEKISSHKANSLTGKYALALTPGKKYKIVIESEGVNPRIEIVDLRSLDSYVKANQDFKLYSNEYKLANNIKDSTPSFSLQNNISVQVQSIKGYDDPIANKQYEEKVFQSLLKTYSDQKKDSVSFAIELGNYEYAADFNPSKINELGAISNKVNEKGNTVFSIGSFSDLLSAEIFKYKLFQKDSSFSNTYQLIVMDHGKRTILSDYYKAEYYQKRNYSPTEISVVKSRYNLSPNSNDTANYNLLCKNYGTLTRPDVNYTVEIASLRDSTQFKKEVYSPALKIQHASFPDGFTKYTVGTFNTLNDAENAKKELATVPNTFPFVTALHSNERKSVVEDFKNYLATSTSNQKKDSVNSNPIPPSLTSLSSNTKNEIKDTIIATTAATTSVIDTLKQEVPIIAKSLSNNSKDEPCNADPNLNFSAFVGKDLNDTTTYTKFIALAEKLCVEGLTFKVQIGAYRHPENYKYKNLQEFGPAEIKAYPDGITRFTMKEFKTLGETESFRKKVLKKGTKDAWIIAFYKGERKVLQDLIAVNFYIKSIN